MKFGGRKSGTEYWLFKNVSRKVAKTQRKELISHRITQKNTDKKIENNNYSFCVFLCGSVAI